MAEESKQTTKKTSTSTTSSTITTIRDQKVMSEYNNGPVIESFTPPASCLSTLTFSTDMYFGHRRNAYFDPACYPEKSTNASGWDMYYCKYLPSYGGLCILITRIRLTGTMSPWLGASSHAATSRGQKCRRSHHSIFPW